MSSLNPCWIWTVLVSESKLAHTLFKLKDILKIEGCCSIVDRMRERFGTSNILTLNSKDVTQNPEKH